MCCALYPVSATDDFCTISFFFTSQLFLFLQDFSQRMLSKTHEIEKQLDSLIRDTKATDSCLHSVFNDFLMLSNTQFIENVIHHTGTFFFHFCCAHCTTTTVTNLSLHVRASHVAVHPLVTKHFFWLCGPLQRVYDEEVEEAVKPDGTNKQTEQVRNSLCNGALRFQGFFRDKSCV